MWANFKQKGKAIALLFDEKLPIFNGFHVAQKCIAPNCMWATFKQKGKAIALLFDEKLPIFNDFSCGTKSI